MTWAVDYRVRGGRQQPNRRYTLGKYPLVGIALARKEARAVLAKAQLGEDPHATRVEARKAETASGLTFHALAAAMMARFPLRQTTRYTWGGFLKNHLASLHERPAESIKRREVQALLDAIVVEKSTTAVRLLEFVHWVYARGIEREMVEVNPAAQMPRPAAVPVRERVYSPDEMKRLWAAFGTQRYGLVCRLVLMTGLRVNEALGAPLSEFDMDANLWRIPGERMKEGKPHLVPLDGVLPMLSEQVFPQSAKGWLFPSVRGGGHLTENWTAIVKMREASGVPDLMMHSLRHTTATRLLELGTPQPVVAAVLAHAQPIGGVTAQYLHYAYLEERRDALKRWSEHLAKVVA